MKPNVQRDFTQGSIPRHLLLFSLPMFAGNVLQVLYNTVDSIWVGRFIGPEALGAVSISGPLIFALLSLVMGLTMATTTLVAQYRGAGDEPMVRRTVVTSLLLLGAGGVIVSVTGALLRYPLLRLIATPASIIDQSADYLGIFMAGILGMFLFNSLSAILRGLGDSKTPLKALAIATVANILLDPLFIFGFGPFPKMGVAGAALATILSQALSAVILWRWVARNTDLLPKRLSHWQIDWPLARQITTIGLPAGVQQMIVSFGMVAVTAIINGFGTNVVAAFGAASRLDQFAFMPALSIGLAVTSLVGQNLGAGKFDRVAATVRWSCGLTMLITSLITAVAVFKPTLLMVLFTDNPQVLAEGSAYLRIIGPSYLAFALLFVLGGVFRGAGDTIPAMIFAVVGLWGFRVPLAAYFARSMGSQGIWLGIALSALAGLLMHWGWYLTGRWKKRIVKPGPARTAEIAAD